MSETVLSGAEFHSEEAAYAAIEAKLWPNGPVCPHCGVIGRAYALIPYPGDQADVVGFGHQWKSTLPL